MSAYQNVAVLLLEGGSALIALMFLVYGAHSFISDVRLSMNKDSKITRVLVGGIWFALVYIIFVYGAMGYVINA